MIKIRNLYSNKSFVALISVLAIAAIGTAISLSVIVLGLLSSKRAFLLEQSFQANSLAEACSEWALEKLRESIDYAGNETLNFANGSCQILSVLGTGNSNRTVQAIAVVSNVTRKIEINIAVVSPQIQLTDWKEVAEF